MTDIVRFGMGMAVMACEEADAGNKLIVISREGKPLKEIVVPSQH